MILPFAHRRSIRTTLWRSCRAVLGAYAQVYSLPRRPAGMSLGTTLVLALAAVTLVGILAMALHSPVWAVSIAFGARYFVHEVRSDRAARATAESPNAVQAYGADWSRAFLESRPLDRATAEAGAVRLYRAAGQPPPALRIWTRSPRELYLAERLIGTMLDAIADDVETTAAWDQALAGTRPDQPDEAWSMAVAHIEPQLLAQTPLAASVTRLGAATAGSRPDDGATSPIRIGIGPVLQRTLTQRLAIVSQLRFEGRAEAAEWASRIGVARSHGLAHLAWHEFRRDDVGQPLPDEWEAVGTMIRACDGWLLIRGAVLFLEPPLRTIADDQGRLHGDTGPAVAYGDAFAIWAQHGATLPRVAVESPAELTIDLLRASVLDDMERQRQLIRIYGEDRYRADASATLERIAAEPLPAIRRLLIETYGVGRYAQAVGEVIASDIDGLGQARRLWRVRRPGDDVMVLVEVANSTPEADGSRRSFWLRVPPHISTCQEAVAWTFGVRAGDYRPLVET